MTTVAVIADTHLPRGSRRLPEACLERLSRADAIVHAGDSLFPGCDAVVYGHTHVPEASASEGRWILNPGSPTERRRAPAHSMLELRIEGREVVPRLVELQA